MASKNLPADFTFANHGSVTVLKAVSKAARVWVAEYLPDSAMTWGGGTVIEPRYAGPILDGIADAGLLVEGV